MSDERRARVESLTERELEILHLISDGLSNQQIADKLFLTRDTVKWYNSQVYQKLGVRSRTQAIAEGRARGLLPPLASMAQPEPALELPLQTTIFIGRKRELVDTRSRLADPTCRLLTLVGAGGMGKTRLALEAAGQFVKRHPDAFPQGVAFVSLQPLNSPDFIVSALAEALHFQPMAADKPKQGLLAYLRDKSFLLILDNFEHLLDGAGFVSEILAAAPDVKVLATSREALNLQEEWLYPVPGMSYPDDLHDLESYESIQLFTHHAQRIRASFSLAEEAEGVIRICALAEGMPLALELAAAWVRALSCSEIADEIKAGLDILETPARNVLPRHRNMRAVLKHSWMLLSDAQRDAFMKLAVFRGGFTREAAQLATDASIRSLSALLDKSWLRWDAARKRYDVHELLRQYGQECLQENPDEWELANERHAHYYAGFVQQRWQDLRGTREREAYTEIESEMENVRAYWDWVVSHQRAADIEAAQECLWLFYDMGSRYQEGERAFAQAANALRDGVDSPAGRLLYGKVLARHGAMVGTLNRYEESRRILRESRRILGEFDAPSDMAFCLFRLSLVISDVTSPEWEALIQESLDLYRQIGDLSGIGEALTGLAIVYQFHHKDVQRAVELIQEALAACLQAGDQRGIATAYSHLAGFSIEQGLYDEARQYARKCLAIFQPLGIVWGITMGYLEYGRAAYGLGEYAEARKAVYYALTLAAKNHLVRRMLSSLILIGKILLAQNERERALELFALADEKSNKMGSHSFAKEIILKLESELPSDQYQAAIQRGRLLDLETVVKAVLDEIDQEIFAGR